MFGQPVVEREERGLEVRIARDCVEVVNRNEGELLEAFEQLWAVRAKLRKRQVSSGASAAARLGACGLKQVTAARPRWTVNPDRRA